MCPVKFYNLTTQLRNVKPCCAYLYQTMAGSHLVPLYVFFNGNALGICFNRNIAEFRRSLKYLRPCFLGNNMGSFKLFLNYLAVVKTLLWRSSRYAYFLVPSSYQHYQRKTQAGYCVFWCFSVLEMLCERRWLRAFLNYVTHAITDHEYMWDWMA